MRNETQELIKEIRHTVSTKIPVSWRSHQPMPGSGDRRSTRRGTAGFDFASLEDYQDGDDASHIDWWATAQTGGQRVLVRKTFEPRDINFVVLADVGPTMDFGTVRVTKRILAAELTCAVLECARKSHDRAAFIPYSVSGVDFRRCLRPGPPDAAIIPALAAIIESQPGRGEEGTENPSLDATGFQKALTLLPRERSLVVVISDFLALKEGDRIALRRAAIKHDVICFLVEDRRERELPVGRRVFGREVGFYALVDMATGEQRAILLSAKNRKAYSDNRKLQQARLLDALRQSNCDPVVFSTEQGQAMFPSLLQVLSNHRR